MAAFFVGVVIAIFTQCFICLFTFPVPFLASSSFNILYLQNMRLYLHMRSTTKALTSLMKLPTTSAKGGADPSLQKQTHLSLKASAKQSTSDSEAWGRTSTWSWGTPRKAWLHLASPSRSWERMAPRAWGPTIRMTSAFTKGHWGQGSTPLWHYPHAWGWWVKTKMGCRMGSEDKKGKSVNSSDKGCVCICISQKDFTVNSS